MRVGCSVDESDRPTKRAQDHQEHSMSAMCVADRSCLSSYITRTCVLDLWNVDLHTGLVKSMLLNCFTRGRTEESFFRLLGSEAKQHVTP